jgi:hypothetical protein
MPGNLAAIVLDEERRTSLDKLVTECEVVVLDGTVHGCLSVILQLYVY